jgi:hypothetical protein
VRRSAHSVAYGARELCDHSPADPS